jgi:acyl carrier protein
MVQELVRREAARVLGIINPHSIDALQPLQELGLDSLMAVQFRNVLARWAAVDLPATLLYSYPTLDQLADFLDSCIFAGQPSNAGERTVPEQSAELSEAELNELSEDDLVRLLEQEIGSAR